MFKIAAFWQEKHEVIKKVIIIKNTQERRVLYKCYEKIDRVEIGLFFLQKIGVWSHFRTFFVHIRMILKEAASELMNLKIDDYS